MNSQESAGVARVSVTLQTAEQFSIEPFLNAGFARSHTHAITVCQCYTLVLWIRYFDDID